MPNGLSDADYDILAEWDDVVALNRKDPFTEHARRLKHARLRHRAKDGSNPIGVQDPELMSTTNPSTYSRQTLLCAADMLKALGHSGLSRFLLELELPGEGVGGGSGLMDRVTSLAKFAISHPEHLSPERRTVAYEIILRASEIWREGTIANLNNGERDKFAAAMQREGQSISRTESLTLGGEDAGDGVVGASITFSGPDLDQLKNTAAMPESTIVAPSSRKVFVVHGRDDATRNAVALFLERAGLEPIILHEQPNKGRTIITKFREEAAGTGFAVVLMTPDDHGGQVGSAATRSRARQNVVFELGFFIGAFGPERVAALVKGEVEKPSDFDGVVYISLDRDDWKSGLAKELEAAGFEINWRRAVGT